jgi:thioredoxin-like negative regulator of GroEL
MLHRDALELELELLGADHPDVAVTRRSLATLLAARGELVEAEELLRLSLATRERSLPPASLLRVVTVLDLASALHGQGRDDEAAERYETALETTQSLASDATARVMALSSAAAFFEGCGEPERATELRRQLSPRPASGRATGRP